MDLSILQAQGLILTVLGVGAFAVEVFALVDVLRQRDDAFVAAGKRTKRFWSLVVGIATLVGFVTMGNVLGLVGIVAFVAAAVYLADVRPALRQVTGGGRANGPYGPW